MDEAFELLDARQAERALAIGRRLEEEQCANGCEIQALAHHDLGDNESAIQVLKKGLKHHAGYWVLWQLLGNFLSDEDAFEEALAAHDRALELPDADWFSLQYNRAIVLWRLERVAEARGLFEDLLKHAEFGSQPWDLRLHIESAQLGILVEQGNDHEAIARFEKLAMPSDQAKYASLVAELEADYATALFYSGRREDAESAVLRAIPSIRLDKTKEHAQWLLRELRRTDGPVKAQFYTLLIEGPWRASACEGPIRFFVTYHVVAENLDEAMRFVREFESPETRDALKIEEITAQEPSDQPKGVYWISAYYVFHDEEEQTPGSAS